MVQQASPQAALSGKASACLMLQGSEQQLWHLHSSMLFQGWQLEPSVAC